ncbi:MAG: permease [Aestuariibacter sp.]
MTEKIAEFLSPVLQPLLESHFSVEMAQAILNTLSLFIFLAVELTILFVAVSFIIGVILEYMPAEKIQKILGSKGGSGYVSAALLGSLTPFCSCSTIPMLTGLLKARAGFGPTLTFLFTSPLLNPIIFSLLLVTFGLKVTLVYATIGLAVSITSGYMLEKMGFQRYVREDVVNGDTVKTACSATIESTVSSSCSSSQEPQFAAPHNGDLAMATATCSSAARDATPSCGPSSAGATSSCGVKSKSDSRWSRIWTDSINQFKRIFPILMIGVAIGSLTYGFVPEDFIVKYAGPDNPLAIPFAAFIGVPLYIRAEAVIPLASALAAKGMGLGALMALVIGSGGASLPEVILLKSLFRNPLIIAFLTVVFSIAIIAGLVMSGI